jgi:outer membrane protein insertion porin family
MPRPLPSRIACNYLRSASSFFCWATLALLAVSSAAAQYGGYPGQQPYGDSNPYLAQPGNPGQQYAQPQYAPPGYPGQPVGQPQYQPASVPIGNGFQSPNPYLPPGGATTTYQPGTAGFGPPPVPGVAPGFAPGTGPSGSMMNPNGSPFNPPSFMPSAPEYLQPPPNTTPLDVYVEETRTGRFMFGVAVNSDAGVTGQINGTAWRGAGQGFRAEAQPGSQVQRYMISFTEPYFLDTNISFSTSAFYFDRGYYDWSESRYGGRIAWGYRLTPALSVTTALRAENVNLFNPRILTVPELNSALGKSDIFSGKVTLTHDTRDLPFMPTEGHMIEMSYEQAFGSYDFPRAEVDWYQYFMLSERPDGSGRHTIAVSSRVGVTGSQTPIFENYFAGGFSTMRGFGFRGASPIEQGVRVGGEFRWLNSVEYFFPLTADDMIKGTVFVDFGTVERDVALRGENFRVAPGFGLRINVPALGPAPLALDFAFPLAMADGDDEQMFSFFFGLSRQ